MMIIAEVLQNVDKANNVIKEAGISMSSDAFWGILGSLAGTVIGALIGYLLSELHNHGRLQCFVKSWHAHLDMLDERGEYVTCYEYMRPEFFNYDFTIEIYNSSRLPKIIRNGKIVFCKDEEPLKEFTPHDKSREKKYVTSSTFGELLAFCVPATGVLTLDLLGTIMGGEEGFSFLENANEVYFQYNDEKNRTRKWKISDVSYDSYFDSDTGDENNG